MHLGRLACLALLAGLAGACDFAAGPDLALVSGHRHIVKFKESFEEAGDLFIVLDLPAAFPPSRQTTSSAPTSMSRPCRTGTGP